MVTDDEIAAAMLAHPEYSTSSLANFLGVRQHFIQYRITQPGFAYKVAILRNAGFTDAAEIGKAGLIECLEVLKEEMRSSANFSGERIQAARAYVDTTIKCHKISHQDLEILRLRAFIEENERRRTGGVTLDWTPEGEEESGSAGIDSNRAARSVDASEGGVRVSAVNLEEVPAESTQEISTDDQTTKVIAPEVQKRLLDIAKKSTGEE